MKESIAVLLLSLVFVSCGGPASGTMHQKGERAYLRVVGNSSDIVIAIDDGQQFPIDPMTDRYEVKPGKHSLKIYRNNQLIVNRVVDVGGGETTDVDVP